MEVSQDDIYLAQILDALKDIKKIPATTPENAFIYLRNIIKKEDKNNQLKLANYALNYTPRTRALLGAILKEIGLYKEAFMLKETLNSLTKYKIEISNTTLPSKKYWNIT